MKASAHHYTHKRFWVLAIGIALAISSCGDGATEITGSETGASIYGTVEPLVTGDGQLDFGSLEGQDTVLWFWAPW